MDKKVDLIAKLFITYIFILALCFLVYSLVVLPTNGAEKVNAIIGLLGWSATIYTPVAAYFLLDSWKDQTKYNANLELLTEMVQVLSEISNAISEVRQNPRVCTSLMLNILHKPKFNEDFEQDKFELPDFKNIFALLEKLRVLNLKIYLYDDKVSSHAFMSKSFGRDAYDVLSSCIKGLDASFYRVNIDDEASKADTSSEEYKELLQRCFYISNGFYHHYRSNYDPSVVNKYSDKLNLALDNAFKDIIEFRKSLN